MHMCMFEKTKNQEEREQGKEGGRGSVWGKVILQGQLGLEGHGSMKPTRLEGGTLWVLVGFQGPFSTIHGQTRQVIG